MPTKGEKAKFIGTEARIMIDDNFFPLGKIESVEAITADTEIPAETIGVDMTGFAIGGTETITMELNIEKPLLLKLNLMGVPVVNVITCKNCVKRNTTRCPAWRSHFGDNDTCSKGELKCQTE